MSDNLTSNPLRVVEIRAGNPYELLVSFNRELTPSDARRVQIAVDGAADEPSAPTSNERASAYEMQARFLLRQARCPECDSPGYGTASREACVWCRERDAVCKELLQGLADEPPGLMKAARDVVEAVDRTHDPRGWFESLAALKSTLAGLAPPPKACTQPGCTVLCRHAHDAEGPWVLPAVPPGAADLIREAFATMQSHAERHARKADKAKEDYWSSAHAAYAKRSEDWCARAQSFLDGAAPPPGECQHAETIDLEDAHARWCTECGAFHDGTQWIHSRRGASPPSAVDSLLKRRPVTETGSHG